MKRFLLLLLSALTVFSLFAACGGNTSPEKSISPSEKLLAKYSEIANDHASLSEAIAKKGDMTLSGKYSRIAIDLTDIASAITKAGENISDEDIAKYDAELTKCEETLSEIKELLQ